jgi:hypothetical protein
MNDYELYQRMARMEERAILRDEKINDICSKVDELYKALVAGNSALTTARWFVGVIGAAAGTIAALIIKFLPFSSTLPK